MKIEHLNATFQPAKIGNPHGLQITYLKDNSTRNIFVYHEDGKVRAGGWQGLACAPGGWCCMQPDWGTPVSNPAVTWGGGVGLCSVEISGMLSSVGQLFAQGGHGTRRPLQ